MELTSEQARRQEGHKINQTASTLGNIDFFMNNVMNISEATRKNKLALVLEEFSTEDGEENVYIIQNSKKKEAAGVVTSLRHYRAKEERLKELQDELLRLSEENLMLKAKEREHQPSLSFAEAVQNMQLDEEDLKDIFDHADEVNID
ncbi:hypothetical protein [Saccharibacillus brassicae]|uniref:Uncharacterized protein n=1 Tax=Saccharibacillus brassicae TaxID=2583377 RepID=A0A4Y6UY80_SACBS|nr:hypothetical protein [Saccharibacillus brassicae]QDH22104.1 hypothetical protein FFV09_15380 [Saccharibacillus brassicae]